MSEYINIVSKEAITAVPTWIALLGSTVCTLLVLSTFIYWTVIKDPNKVFTYLGTVGSIAIILSIAWMCISCVFFKEPTGQYNYKATIDKNNITVSKYEQFIKEYHPDIKDDVYYFTGGDLE